MNPACTDLDPQLAEFALGLLGGDDRARVVDHVRSCPHCRAEVDALSVVADELIGALADQDPPPGFEGRVLARLDRASPASSDPSRGRREPSRVALLAAGVVLALAIGAALIATRPSPPPTDAAATRVAAMHTPAGRSVGTATLSGDPAGILLSTPSWSTTYGGPYRLRVVTDDGSVHRVGPIELDEGYGGYGLGGIGIDDVARVEMIDAAGDIACSADFA